MKKITALLIVLMLTFTFMVTASAATVLKGDVDMNGKVTAADARTVLRAAARLQDITETQKIIADVSGDEKVTASDARTILRRAANIEKDLGTVEIEDAASDPTTVPVTTTVPPVTETTTVPPVTETTTVPPVTETTTVPPVTETTTVPPVTRTELSVGINMNYKSFMEKYGAMRKVGRTDGITEYTNDKMTIISDPYMVRSGNVSSIIITGGNYTLCGVNAGMSKDDALNTLKADKWLVREDSTSSVRLTKNAMVMLLDLNGNTVVRAEYTFAESTLPPDERPTETTTQNEEPGTLDETTTKAEETTTTVDITTTEPTTEPTTTETTTVPEPSTEETTTSPEPTTKDEPTTAPLPDGDVEYDDLPSQIKCFLEGHFGIIGYNYSQGSRNAVTMYISPDDVKAGMSLDTGSGSISLDILIKDVKGKSVTYIVIPGEKKYCELTAVAMGILGIKPDDLKIDFGTSTDEYKSIVRTHEKSGGVDYVVYTIDTGKEYCKIFTVNDEIKRIETYNSTDGVMKSRLDVTTFITDVPPSVFSLDGLKKKSFLELFGGLLM